MRKPWFREQNQYWYAWFQGKQHRLCKGRGGEAEAYRQWNCLMQAASPEAHNAPLAALCEAFLEWCQKNREPKTYSWYLDYLVSLCKSAGTIQARKLKRFHITRWLDANKWQGSGRRGAITAVTRVLNWSVDEGLLEKNPVGKLERPQPERREIIVDDATHRKMLAAADRGYRRQYRRGCFRLFLIALRHSGCRPGEVARVTAENFHAELAVWVFTKHKTKRKTERSRIVHLSPCLHTISRILAHHRPTGTMFRNSEGEAWSITAIDSRIARLRRSLGLGDGITAYSFRHTFTTEGLVNGVSASAMAELLGHTGTSMISRHYSHLDQKTEHLKSAVRLALEKRDDSRPAQDG